MTNIHFKFMSHDLVTGIPSLNTCETFEIFRKSSRGLSSNRTKSAIYPSLIASRNCIAVRPTEQRSLIVVNPCNNSYHALFNAKSILRPSLEFSIAGAPYLNVPFVLETFRLFIWTWRLINPRIRYLLILSIVNISSGTLKSAS